MTKLTKEQYEHLRKGGYFRAIYKPTKLDVGKNFLALVGKDVVIWPNHGHVVPYIDDQIYFGQFRFDIQGLSGWCPEEDFEILEPINKFVNVQYKDNHQYRMTYLDNEVIFQNFGNGYTAPMIVGRSFDKKNHDYIFRLSQPPANKTEYRVWKFGMTDEDGWKYLINKK